MTPHEATRTLVKSPPEVWAQCSEAEALERHLNGSFGEIRITRLEPETAVTWEGEQVRGTVRIEPSAWGTRVTLTALFEEDPCAGPEALEMPPIAATDTTEATNSEALPAQSAETAQPAQRADPADPAETAQREETVPEPAAEPPTPASRPNSMGLWARLRMRFRAPFPPPDQAGPPPVLPGVAPPPPVAEGLASEPEEPPVSEASRVKSTPTPTPKPTDLTPAPTPEATDLTPAPTPEATELTPAPTPEATQPRPDPMEVLHAALESLGQAHHRPFSRA